MKFCRQRLCAASLLAVFSCGRFVAHAEEGKPAAPTPAPAPLTVAEIRRDMPVDFEKEVLPFLKNSCLACHNQTKAKGGLNLETPQTILKGGDTGPAVAPGRSADSLIFKAAAHLDRELIMPPRDNKANAADFSPEQLALLKLWIDQGAKGEVRAAAPVNWLEKPPALDPIFAVALTSDGQFAACGRGNRIDVYHVPSGQLVARLADAKLAASGLAHAAHRDVVNSLAFNPDGTLLASAGYREVKLWQRPRPAPKLTLTMSNAVAAFVVSPDRKWLAVAGQAIALWDLSTGQLARTLAGHSNTIAALKFSPNSAQLASVSDGKVVRVWNVPDGSLTASAESPSELRAVVWLTGGQQLAAGSADGLVRVFELSSSRREEAHSSPDKDQSLATPAATLKLVKELKAHEGPVTSLDALASANEFLSGSADGLLRQWKPGEDKPVREIKHGGPVTAVAVRPDGSRFASTGTNHAAKLWQAADGKLIAELKGDRYAYELVAETGRALVVAKADSEFRRKSLDTAELEYEKQTNRVAKAAETNAVTEKVFAEKEKALKDAQAAKAGAEKALADLLAEIQKVTESFESADKSAQDAASKAKAAAERATQTRLAAERASLSKVDTERIAADAAAVAAKTRAATGIDLPDDAKAAAQKVAEDAAAVAQKTKSLAEAVIADAGAKSKMAADARAAADKAVEEVAALAFAAGQFKPAYDKTVAEAPEKRKQATNQVEQTAKAIAPAEGELKKAETRRSVTSHELELAQQSQKRATDTLAGAKSARAAADTAQQQIESDLERQQKVAVAAETPFRALAFSPDGLTLATLGDDRRVHTWSAETGAAFEVFGNETVPPLNGNAGSRVTAEDALPLPRRGGEGRGEGAIALAFLDASTLAATDDQRVTLWDVQPAWTLVRTLGTGDIDSPLADRVNAVRFSPDGQTLATGGGEPTRSGEIKLWNVADGKFLREFKEVHSDAVLALDFSPDGKFLASSSADRFVRVVDLAGGKVAKAFEGHTSYVLGVAWKRDGRTLASAGADNVIKVWDFLTGERRKNIEGAGKEVTSIAFVGATGEAVAASGDGQVRMVRENGDKVRSFEGAADFINAAAATPDGLTIVAGGQDSVLRVWNGSDAKLVQSFAPARGK